MNTNENLNSTDQIDLQNNLVIRFLRNHELPLLEWDGEYLKYRRLFADIFQRTLQGNSIMWVADLHPIGIVGQVFVQLISSNEILANGKSRAYLFSFRVKPAYRNMKIGTRILEEVEFDLNQRGFQYSTLNVAKDNPLALAFYRRNGYQIIGDDPGKWSYFDHKGKIQHVCEPAWRMQKRIR